MGAESIIQLDTSLYTPHPIKNTKNEGDWDLQRCESLAISRQMVKLQTNILIELEHSIKSFQSKLSYGHAYKN